MDNINFNTKTKRDSFVTAKEPAWHGKGIIVDHTMTSSEALEYAGLDYRVVKGQLYVALDSESRLKHNRTSKIVNNGCATYRDDTLDVFGVVTSSYEVLQNKEVFKFMDKIIGKGLAKYETAGALGKGEIVFITAKLPYNIELSNKDLIDYYIVAATSHDGSRPLQIFLTPIRVVCQNTLSIGIYKSEIFMKAKHTSNMDDKMDDILYLFDNIRNVNEKLKDTYNSFISYSITDIQAEDYFNKVFLTESEYLAVKQSGVSFYNCSFLSQRKINILKDVNKYYSIGVGQSNIKDTVFGAYQAVSGYLCNVAKYRTDDDKVEGLILDGKESKLLDKALSFTDILINK